MQFVAVLSFLTPATNAVYPQRICLFFVGSGPFFVVGSAFVCSRTKRKSGWGICGSSFVGPCLCFFVVSAFRGLLHVHGHSAMYFSSFYHFYFCQDRASGNIGRTRKKKKVVALPLTLGWMVPSGVLVQLLLRVSVAYGDSLAAFPGVSWRILSTIVSYGNNGLWPCVAFFPLQEQFYWPSWQGTMPVGQRHHL